MLIPVDDIILNSGRKLREISAKTPDANDQVPVILGVNFGVSQFLGVHHIVLNMRTAV
jgi:hypothetical protein